MVGLNKSDWKGYCSSHINRHIGGFIKQAYSGMRARVTGKDQKSRKYPHLYLGKEILSRKEFNEWANNSLELNRLFDFMKA